MTHECGSADVLIILRLAKEPQRLVLVDDAMHSRVRADCFEVWHLIARLTSTYRYVWKIAV